MLNRCRGTLARRVLDPFLDQLSNADQMDLLNLGQPRSFRRGASKVMHGDRSDAVSVLLRGRVKVSLDTVAGHETVLAVLRPGYLVGEFEAIDKDGGPGTASNVALESLPVTDDLEHAELRLRPWNSTTC